MRYETIHDCDNTIMDICIDEDFKRDAVYDKLKLMRIKSLKRNKENKDDINALENSIFDNLGYSMSHFYYSFEPEDFIDFSYRDMKVFDDFFANCTKYIDFPTNYISHVLQSIRDEMLHFSMFVNMLAVFTESKVSIKKNIDVEKFSKFCGDYMENIDNIYADVPFDIAMGIMFDRDNDFVVMDYELDNFSSLVAG